MILGLPVRLDVAQRVEVCRLHPARAPKGPGVRGMQVRPWLATVRAASGLSVTSAATTWAILGRRLSVEALVVFGDAAVYSDRQRRSPIATFAELSEAAAAPSRPGGARLRHALTLVRDGSASPPETQLRLVLSAAGLPAPELDVDVRDSRGRLLGRSEIAYPDSRVAIEYESDHHRVDRQQWDRDLAKYQSYAEAGWRVIRVTAELLQSGRQEVARQVTAALGSA